MTAATDVDYWGLVTSVFEVLLQQQPGTIIGKCTVQIKPNLIMKKILQPSSLLLIVLSIAALSCKKDSGDPPVTPDIPEEVYEPEISAGAGVTDLDGQVYGSVIIGNQEWMTENLRTSQYSNGDP